MGPPLKGRGEGGGVTDKAYWSYIHLYLQRCIYHWSMHFFCVCLFICIDIDLYYMIAPTFYN